MFKLHTASEVTHTDEAIILCLGTNGLSKSDRMRSKRKTATAVMTATGIAGHGHDEDKLHVRSWVKVQHPPSIIYLLFYKADGWGCRMPMLRLQAWLQYKLGRTPLNFNRWWIRRAAIIRIDVEDRRHLWHQILCGPK